MLKINDDDDNDDPTTQNQHQKVYSSFLCVFLFSKRIVVWNYNAVFFFNLITFSFGLV